MVQNHKTERAVRHTPGPWGYTDYPNGLMPEGMIGVGKVLQNIALVETRHGVEIGKANACLISAAPDLLSVAEMWVDVWHDAECDWRLFPELVMRTQSAINKAYGK